MRLYLSNGRTWTGTQADAKAAQGGTDYETIEIPEPKAERIAWLNEQWEKMLAGQSAAPAPAPAAPSDGRVPAMSDEQRVKFEGIARRMGWVPASEIPEAAPAAAPVSKAAVDYEKPDNLAEAIIDCPKEELPGILTAAMGRLGEVGGLSGWGSFAKDCYGWTPAARNVEQGLGMLFLAAMEGLAEVSVKKKSDALAG